MLKKGRLAFASTFLLLVAIAVAACGTTSTPSPTATAGPKGQYTYTKPPTTGGTIIMSDWETPTTDNPLFNNSTTGLELGSGLYGSPWALSSDGTMLPDELTRIPTQANGDVSKDGLTVTLHLNPNLKWSDGMPITSSDFIYTIKLILDPATAVASQNGFTPDTLASYTAPDPQTVVLTYVKPFAPYLFYLPYPLPEHAWGTIADKDLSNTPSVNLNPTVTSGPFMVQSATAGVWTLVPNKYYTSTSLHPTVLDKLIYKIYQTKDALIAGYSAGETDHAEDFTLGDYQKLNNLPGLQVTSAITDEFINFNLSTPVLQDINVRKAIVQAVDRCNLIVSILHVPCAQVKEDALVPPPLAQPTTTQYAFDVNAAKADMQAGGWTLSGSTWMKNGQAFPTLNLVTTSGNSLRTSSTELIKQDLATIDIPINLDGQYYPAGVLFGDYGSGGTLATGKFDLSEFADGWTPDMDGNLYSFCQSGQIPTAANPSGGNWDRINDPTIDQLLAQGRTTLDPTARNNIYVTLQKYMITQAYFMPLYVRPNITLTDNKVGNYFPNGATVNQWNDGEWYLKQ